MSEFLQDGLELFATCCVRDYSRAAQWYRSLLGTEPAFMATETEAVWELALHRWLVVEQRPAQAGHGVVTLFVSDLERRVADASQRGVTPEGRESYEGGVTKVIFRDPDGNEVGFGGRDGPSESA